MCCLFGLYDYGGTLSAKQKNRMIAALAAASEVRGIDATGIAYCMNGHLSVYKRPLPAHWMRFRIPEQAAAVMGHTRMTTQGSEYRNYNNHPFSGKAGQPFALAHNGVLTNDLLLRRQEKLPVSKIETDSFIIVQLLEQAGSIGFQTLRDASERLAGSFTYPVLDGGGRLYIVRGNNPFCLYHWPEQGLYLYASTQAVLDAAVFKIRKLLSGSMQKIPVRRRNPSAVPGWQPGERNFFYEKALSISALPVPVLRLLLAGCTGQYRLRRGASPDGPGIRILGEGRGYTASRRDAAGGD